MEFKTGKELAIETIKNEIVDLEDRIRISSNKIDGMKKAIEDEEKTITELRTKCNALNQYLISMEQGSKS